MPQNLSACLAVLCICICAAKMITAEDKLAGGGKAKTPSRTSSEEDASEDLRDLVCVCATATANSRVALMGVMTAHVIAEASGKAAKKVSADSGDKDGGKGGKRDAGTTSTPKKDGKGTKDGNRDKSNASKSEHAWQCVVMRIELGLGVRMCACVFKPIIICVCCWCYTAPRKGADVTPSKRKGGDPEVATPGKRANAATPSSASEYCAEH